MDEFPANSANPPKKEPEAKKVTKVVTGEVSRRKKPLHKRFAETFGMDDMRGVFNYITMDVLIPAGKDMIADAVSQGVERMVFGEARSSSRRTGSRPGNQNYTNYNRYATSGTNRQREPERPSMSRRARSSHNFDEIVLNTRGEAEEVIDRLFDLVSRYNSASVADLYELVGISGDYTDDKWGWTDLRGAGVERVRNGYLLALTKPEPLD